MRILVDTHALLWAVTNDNRLSERAAETLASPRTDVYVSAATAWEIVTKVRLGKLSGADQFVRSFHVHIERLGFHTLDMTVKHSLHAGSLSGPHKDPFDRMLIAQSLSEALPIVSNEKIFDHYGVTRIW